MYKLRQRYFTSGVGKYQPKPRTDHPDTKENEKAFEVSWSSTHHHRDHYITNTAKFIARKKYSLSNLQKNSDSEMGAFHQSFRPAEARGRWREGDGNCWGAASCWLHQTCPEGQALLGAELSLQLPWPKPGAGAAGPAGTAPSGPGDVGHRGTRTNSFESSPGPSQFLPIETKGHSGPLYIHTWKAEMVWNAYRLECVYLYDVTPARNQSRKVVQHIIQVPLTSKKNIYWNHHITRSRH